jgi:hypothetical protein
VVVVRLRVRRRFSRAVKREAFLAGPPYCAPPIPTLATGGTVGTRKDLPVQGTVFVAIDTDAG